jgi:hypothetical protein
MTSTTPLGAAARLGACSLLFAACLPGWRIPRTVGLADGHPPARNPPDLVVRGGRATAVLLDRLEPAALAAIETDWRLGRTRVERADLAAPGAGTPVEIEATRRLDVRRVLRHDARVSLGDDRRRTTDRDLSLPLCPALARDAPCRLWLRPGSWSLGLYRNENDVHDQSGGFVLAVDERPLRLRLEPPARAKYVAGVTVASLGAVMGTVGLAFLAGSALAPGRESSEEHTVSLTLGATLGPVGVGCVVLGTILAVTADEGTLSLGLLGGSPPDP